MPGAAVHDRIGVAISPIVGAGTWAVTGDALSGVVAGVTCAIGTLLLSPDLDLDGSIDDRWGAARPLWKPYQKIVPHRSLLSHSGFSVLLRVGYLYLMLKLLLLALSQIDDLIALAVEQYPVVVAGAIAGLVFSDLAHTITDRIVTGAKRSI